MIEGYIMNPNYLLKDELIYELGVRGIRSDADVPNLRKLFRTVVSEGLRVEVSNLREVGADELYAHVFHKVNELQNLIAHGGTESSCVVQRFRTRLEHLKGRLALLMELGVFPTHVTAAHYQELHGRLQEIKRNIITLEGTD
jgi:hypothetical protein